MPLKMSDSATRRAFLIALAVLVALGSAALLLWVFWPSAGGMVFPEFPEGSTDEIMYAGRFPTGDDEALQKPMGICSDGKRLYVAESDAGRIAVFTLDARRLDDIEVPQASGATHAYPTSVALMDDDRIAVIDSASSRVLVLSTRGNSEPLMVVGEDAAQTPAQPTALAFAGGELYVADGATHAILVFSAEDGSYLRTLGQSLSPSLTYVGGMLMAEDGLHVADSNAGRVVILNPATGMQVRVLTDSFALPRGITAGIDSEEFVVDTFGRDVSAVTAEGIKRVRVADLQDELAALYSPRDACWIDADGRLYVTDADLGQIAVYNVRLPVVD